MTEKELVEVLSLHADGLKDGVDLAADLMAQKPVEDQRALEALLALARRVQAALVPVEPRPDFVSELKARLSVGARQARLAAIQKQDVRRRQWIGLAAGVGGIIYLVGLMVVGWRLSVALLSLLAGLLGWRAARSSLPKTRPTH